MSLLFDAVVPFEHKISDGELCDMLTDKIRTLSHEYNTVINIDRSYT